MVEREVLDKLLQELKLGSTSLADETSALQVGKILAARLIGTGALSQMGEKGLFSLKLIETETTRVISVLSEEIENGKGVDVLVGKAAAEMLSRIRKEYPLRGKIISLADNSVTINVGSDVGIKKGLTMRILGSRQAGEEAGIIEIVSVAPSSAQGRVIKTTKRPVAGLRVEELDEG